MARPMPPVSPCAPWLCSGTSTPTGLARAAPTRLVARRSTTSMASSITPTGSTTCSSPPPWEGENYEPRNPMESGTLLCPAQLPGAPEPLVIHDLIGINSIEQFASLGVFSMGRYAAREAHHAL